MVISESIYFFVLFTLPAALNIIYNVHIRPVPVIKKDKSVELSECVLFCMAVFFVNMIILRNELWNMAQYLLLNHKEQVAFCKETGFNYLNFMINYFAINLLVSVLVISVWYSIGQYIIRKLRNLFNKAIKNNEELKYDDVWKNLFETKEIIDASECIVKIEKGGELVTAGIIRIYPAPTVENKELALYNTDSVRELFEDDKGKSVGDRMFPFAITEYYDMSNDVLIKFYEMDKYNEYYEKEESE